MPTDFEPGLFERVTKTDLISQGLKLVIISHDSIKILCLVLIYSKCICLLLWHGMAASALAVVLSIPVQFVVLGIAKTLLKDNP